MPRAPRTPEPAPRQRGGKSYTVTLAGGGTLAVTLNVDPFALAGDDRRFVFDIVDKVTGYGKANGKAAKPKAEALSGDVFTGQVYGEPGDTPDESPDEHGEHTGA